MYGPRIRQLAGAGVLCLLSVLAACSDSPRWQAETSPDGLVIVDAPCADALAGARQFMADRPEGSVITTAESAEIRGLFSEAYNICSPEQIQAVRDIELYPWVQNLEVPEPTEP